MTLFAILALSAQATVAEIKLDGEGYLRFTRDGRTVFSRRAKLTVKEGRVANEQGCFVLPTVLAPLDATVEADADGNLYAIKSGAKSRVGRLVLAVFPADAMLSESSGMLVAIERPVLKFPGENGASKLTLVIEPTRPTYVPPTQTAPTPAPNTPPKAAPPKSEPPKVESSPKPQPAPISSTGLTVTILDKAEVDAENVKMADVAKITGPNAETVGNILLGPTPMLGVKRIFDKPLILGRLRAAGVKPETVSLTMSGPVEVTRKGQTIASAQFVDAVVTAVKATQGVAVEYASKEAQPDYIAPLGRLNLVVEALSGINSPTLTAVVGIYVEGKRVNSRTVRLEAAQNPQAVKTGQPVKVLMRAGGAVVEVAGVSKGTGPVGAQVSVEVRLDATTRSTHLGKIIAEGKVEVTL